MYLWQTVKGRRCAVGAVKPVVLFLARVVSCRRRVLLLGP